MNKHLASLHRHTTHDTHEDILAPSLPVDDRTGDGYDWMDTLEHTPWAVLPT